MTTLARSSDFQRSLIALSYFWGVRGEVLGQPLASIGLHSSAFELLSGLNATERERRAAALGAELARLSSALDQRSLRR